MLRVNLNHVFILSARPDVRTKTSWDAPILWQGMFNPSIYDTIHIQLESSIAVTVFAVGRFVPLGRSLICDYMT